MSSSEIPICPPTSSTYRTCAICISECECENKYTCVCGNEYHNECLSKWFSKSSTCPLCRTDTIFDERLKPMKSMSPLFNFINEYTMGKVYYHGQTVSYENKYYTSINKTSYKWFDKNNFRVALLKDVRNEYSNNLMRTSSQQPIFHVRYNEQVLFTVEQIHSYFLTELNSSNNNIQLSALPSLEASNNNVREETYDHLGFRFTYMTPDL